MQLLTEVRNEMARDLDLKTELERGMARKGADQNRRLQETKK